MSQPYTAAVTLIALLVYFLIIGAVARARSQYGIKAPAVTGNEHFERAYRVQMNTLEQMALFLPALWLYAAYVSDRGAAVGGQRGDVLAVEDDPARGDIVQPGDAPGQG